MPSQQQGGLCPCCSGLVFSKCCGPYLAADLIPATPEKLMRSRYVAYTQSDMEYIRKTMCGEALQQFDSEYNKEWSESVEWVKLEVLAVDDVKDYVEFNAYYRLNGLVKCLHEKSIFKNVGGAWYYTGNDDLRIMDSDEHKKPKLGRNDPCYCGSGKKYKKCCYERDRS